VEELALILHLSGNAALYNLSQALPLFDVHNKATYVSRTCSAHGFLPLPSAPARVVFPVLFNLPHPVRGQVAMLACPVVDDRVR